MKFDHEKLEVYEISTSFIKWINELFAIVKDRKAKVPTAESINQLDRASISIVLNIAEGNGKRQMKQRIKFFDDARGSATECAACLDVLIAKGILVTADVLEGKAILISIVSMLSKLINYFENKFAVGEEPALYGSLETIIKEENKFETAKQ